MTLIPKTRGGALWRFALAAVIVVLFTAAATAVAGLLTFKQLAKEIDVTPAIKHARVVIPQPGQAQTILILGSDHRAHTPQSAANSDTIMLVRLDPNSQTINVMSIPRDLQVNIPTLRRWRPDVKDQRVVPDGRAEPRRQDDPAQRVPAA